MIPSVDPELLKILCCPETHQPLVEAPPEVVEQLNARIKAGGVVNRGGRGVSEPVDGGLITEDVRVLYPIVHGVPVLLVDEAVPI
jgi:uncharacterized protein